MFIVEAVCVFAIFVRREGMVAGRNTTFVYMVTAGRFLDLLIDM